MAQDAFVAESVAPAGADWVRRFESLATRVPRVFYRDGGAATQRPTGRATTIWERNNTWLLDEGLSEGAENLTVLVLWDGRSGDGPGGTEDLVHAAERAGAEVLVVDANSLR